MDIAIKVIFAVAFVVLAPFIGGLLSGLDRKFSARMQHRQGPPIIQPFYDVLKLFGKVRKSENRTMRLFVIVYLLCVLVTGVVFFMGGDMLLVIFLTAIASLFFVLAGYSSRSPFSDVGAMREIIQVASYEPMLMIMCAGLYMVTGDFSSASVIDFGMPLIAYLPLVFLGLVFVLTIKFRKSPFDISMSHHAHQELVGGIKTEMSGSTLGMVEIAHWYESVIFLGWVAMFIIGGSPLSVVIAIVVALLVYFLETLIDNNFARVRYEKMLKTSWMVALLAGVINLCGLVLILGVG